MAISSKVLLLLGENKGQAEGTKTKGTWGEQHTVKNNSYTAVPLRGVAYQPNTLLPVKAFTHAMYREGDLSVAQTQAGQIKIGRVSVDLDPVYIPLPGIVENMTAGNGKSNRINFKIFGIRSSGEGDGANQEEHHWFTLTGTNGMITNCAQHCAEEGDFFTLQLSALTWKWEHWRPDGSLLRGTTSAHWDQKGVTMGDEMIAP